MRPVWAGTMPPVIRGCLSLNRDNIRKIALLSVSGGGEGNEQSLPDFEKLAGKPVASLLLSKKEMEDGTHKDRVEGFARKLKAL